MTKTKPAASATATEPTAAGSTVIIVLGFDDKQKPCGARFTGAKPDLVAKAADLMGLNAYEVTTPDVAAVAKKLPVGKLYANGRGFVPNIRQDLYSKVVVELASDPDQKAKATDKNNDGIKVASGLPRAWDEIAPGHLVIAQESLEHGWWEALVINRQGDMLTLRYRDYPHLPKFQRHRTAIALMSPAQQ
jgi:hypothetical protein